jgi:uncharacterized protein HemX
MDADFSSVADGDSSSTASMIGDSTTGAGEETSTSSDSNTNPTHVLASRETKNVLRSKILVFAVLFLSAAAVGFFTYYFLSQEEQNDFETQVDTENVA